MQNTHATVDGFPDVTIEVEMLGAKLGRVVDATLIFNNFTPRTVYAPVRTNDIVRLSHDPSENELLPKVAEVVYKATPRFLSKIDCRSEDAMYQMIGLAVVLGADIQVITTENTGLPSVWLLHSEQMDVPAIARAACLSLPADNIAIDQALRPALQYYSDEQMYLIVAVALVLGAKISTATKPNHITLFWQPKGVDMRLVAEALHISEDPDDLRDIDLTSNYRPGSVPGAEWATGRWTSINEQPINSGTGIANEKQTDSGTEPFRE